ncbi:hypothetical protein Dxin01_03259 [Deinococcus xinjiangensis]|uniref:Peptidyl-prolyl cis-trans isomerase n=1 Tax=Deinococcus xinjiangensis TaxID=457454 RepID=A0ABP9VFZ6_9DEIO
MNKNAALILLTLGLASCAPVAQKTAVGTLTTTKTVTVTPAPVAAPTPAPAPAFTPVAPLSASRITKFDKAQQVIQAGKTYRAVMKTSKGDITLELNSKAAPVAVNNFVFLALNHFYDGTRFHRVIDGFMAQGGDPQSSDLALKDRWGTGGPGYNFMAENNNGLKFDQAGVLGMARAASLDSQGSQFYITLAPADFLSGQYTVFGKVVSGLEVLQSLTKTSRSGAYGEQPIAGASADVLNSVQILVSN